MLSNLAFKPTTYNKKKKPGDSFERLTKVFFENFPGHFCRYWSAKLSNNIINQCSRSVTFGYGSGSADPNHGLPDPDPAPYPALFLSDLQDAI
jgi:hypothetical protein